MKLLDERITGSKQNINAKAFIISYISLWVIIGYRHFILGQTVKEYVDILILTIAVSCFVVTYTVLKGIFISKREPSFTNKKHNIIFEIMYLVLFISAFSFITGTSELSKLLIALVLMVILRFAPVILAKISEKIADTEL